MGGGVMFGQNNSVLPATHNWFNAVLCEDGTVQTCGQNFQGQLGQGFVGPSQSLFVPVPGVNNIIQISVGGDHVLALRSDGTVWTWGNNATGQLGLGYFGGTEPTPTQIPGLSNVVQVFASATHSMVRLDDGTLRAWGYNNSGQLGNGTTVDSAVPVQVLGINTAVDIALQLSASMALLSDGSVYTWGYNLFGNLGNGTAGGFNPNPMPAIGISTAVDIDAGSGRGFAILAGGTAVAWGNNSSGTLGIGLAGSSSTATPTPIVGLNTVVDIVGGDNNSAALLADGSIWVWGRFDLDGLCSTTTTSSNVPIPGPVITDVVDLQMCTTGNSVVAVQNNGSVAIWGDNGEGQMGVGNEISYCDPQYPVISCHIGDPYCNVVYNGINTTNMDDLQCCLDATNFTINSDEVGTIPNTSLVGGRPAYTVTTSGTWDANNNDFINLGLIPLGANVLLDVDLVIPAGVTLTIQDMEIAFSPTSRVLVQQGGRLVLGSFTGTPATRLHGLCDAVWQGVQVQGPGENFARASGAPFPYNYGIFENRNPATIEDAIIGIAGMELPLMDVNALNIQNLNNFILPNDNTTNISPLLSVYLTQYVDSGIAHATAGGVVISDKGMAFQDCFLGINLSWYTNILAQGDHISFIDETSFNTAGLVYPFSVLSPNTLFSEAGVMLRRYANLEIGDANLPGNTFNDHKYGIRVVEGTQLRINLNSFTHNNVGISVFNGIGAPFNAGVRISNNTIEDSFNAAIQCSGVGGLDIALNTINATTPINAGNQIGIFLRASAFDVLNNTINNVTYGTILMSNITPGSLIFENTYDNATISTWAYGNNSPDVQLHCNAYNNYLTAILVSDFIHPTTPLLNETGLFSNQGVCDGIGLLDRFANNSFTPGLPTFFDIMSNISTPFRYYADLGAGGNTIPTVNNPALVVVQNCFTVSIPSNCTIGGFLSDDDIKDKSDSIGKNREAVRKSRYYAQNNQHEEAAALLSDINTTAAKRLLIPYHIKEGNFSEAQNLLNQLPQSSTEDQNYYSLYTVYKNVYESGRQIWEINSSEEATVRSIASSRTATAYDAQSILFLAFGEEFPFELSELPSELQGVINSGGSVTFKKEETTMEQASLQATPNPATNQTDIQYILPATTNNDAIGARWELIDISGRLLQTGELTENSGSFYLPLNNYTNGLYLLQLRQKGQITVQLKLAVVH